MAFTSPWATSAFSKPYFLSPPQGAKERDAIYVAAVPLRAPRGLAQLLASTSYSIGAWDLQHFMVIIKPSSPLLQTLVYDFQPEDPENFYVAFSALSSGQIAGIVSKRSLKRLPKVRCWFVGFSNVSSNEVANKFSEDWSTQLLVGKHDCRHYTNELVQHLTGVHHVLEHLRSTFSGGKKPDN